MPAWKELSPGRPDSVERTVWRALACQSGNAIALSVVTGKDGAEQYNDDAKFAALCEATHAGDVNAILAATRSYGQINGLDFRAVWGLTFAMPVLCAPTDERVVELAPAVANRAGTLLGEWLLKDRPAWGLALLRAGAREGSDRTGATFALGVALIGRAEQESGGERTQLAEEALATLDAMASGRSYTSVWNYARIAATRLVDPERALDDLRSLEAFLLGAALASDVGDEHLASQMRARAANPALLNAAIGSALRLGIDDELTAALGTADAALSASAAWIFYGAGGALAAIPPVPGLGERAVPSGALWRLAREGQREILGRAVAQAYPVSARLATQDGAPRVALTDLGATNAPDLPTVRKMLEGSRHPAYLRAAHIALGWGMDCGLSESELKSAAPGLTFSQVES